MATSVLREDNHRVGYGELFYDLVFVFAITQVSHYLLNNYSLAGAVEAAFLFLAVWWVWIYTTWVLNWLDPETFPVRLLLFGMMGAGLFVSMAIPDAFASRGFIFAGAYVAMQVGRSLYMLSVVWPVVNRRQTYYRITGYFLLSAIFWIWGAAVSEPSTRLGIWTIALGIEYLGPLVSYRVPGFGADATTNWRVSGAHMAERCGLFVIICLGESLLVSGATFGGMEWTGAGLLAFLASILGAGGMWWVYFHIGHRRGAHQIEHAEDTGAIARRSFTYYHIPIVAGVVLGAVGAERAIVHPGDLASLAEGASIVGGLILFLFGNGLFKRESAEWFPLSHWVGLGLAVLVLLAGPWISLLAQTTLAALILIVVAVWEHRSVGGGAPG